MEIQEDEDIAFACGSDHAEHCAVALCSHNFTGHCRSVHGSVGEEWDDEDSALNAGLDKGRADAVHVHEVIVVQNGRDVESRLVDEGEPLGEIEAVILLAIWEVFAMDADLVDIHLKILEFLQDHIGKILGLISGDKHDLARH